MSEWEPELEELNLRESLAEKMGGSEKVERQNQRGKLNIRERIDLTVGPDMMVTVGTMVRVVTAVTK